jgi:putative copper export protein
MQCVGPDVVTVRQLYLLSVYVHVLAVIVWLGAAAFLVLVMVPWLRTRPRVEAAELMRALGGRLRNVGWICLSIIACTGTYNLWARGVRLGLLLEPAWRASETGQLVLAKLAGFVVIAALSLTHDLVLGPRAAQAAAADPGGALALRLRRWASGLARVTVMLALGMVALGVMLVRGCP